MKEECAIPIYAGSPPSARLTVGTASGNTLAI